MMLLAMSLFSVPLEVDLNIIYSETSLGTPNANKHYGGGQFRDGLSDI